MIKPYPDGITSRRTSATMAGLALGLPIVSTSGHLTETIGLNTPPSCSRPSATMAMALAALRLLSDDLEGSSGDRGRTLSLSASLSTTPSRRFVAPQDNRAHRHPDADQRPGRRTCDVPQLVIPALAEHGHDIGFWHEFDPPPTVDSLALPPGIPSWSVEALAPKRR